MKIKHRKYAVIIAVLLTSVALGCGSSSTDGQAQPDSAADAQNLQVANPASQKCLQEGGELTMMEDDDGQMGVCVFNDGSRCEEWALMRGECAKGKCLDQKGLCE